MKPKLGASNAWSTARILAMKGKGGKNGLKMIILHEEKHLQKLAFNKIPSNFSHCPESGLAPTKRLKKYPKRFFSKNCSFKKMLLDKKRQCRWEVRGLRIKKPYHLLKLISVGKNWLKKRKGTFQKVFKKGKEEKKKATSTCELIWNVSSVSRIKSSQRGFRKKAPVG